MIVKVVKGFGNSCKQQTFFMTREQFGQLPLDERTNYLWDHGQCLSQRLVNGNYILCLYELNDFYVEAIYSRQNNRVDEIRPIMEFDQWEQYVDQTIHDLFQMS
ncbi:MAG: hypothetical protein RL226_581 [Bacteroidota bacterium]|jgi:hypothetical protein